MPMQTFQRLAVYQAEAVQCTSCHPQGLLYVDDHRGLARPMLQRSATAALGILIVGEAPNWADTFEPDKGYLTYDADTDPTGRFMRTLLIEEVGLTAAEIGDILFTNAALCLPKEKSGKHPVSTQQARHCRPWLQRLIEDAGIAVVVTMGGKPLEAVRRIEDHRLTLKQAGTLHDWFGRKLLPLYHASRLGRVSRSEALQRQDIRALRELVRDRPSNLR